MPDLKYVMRRFSRHFGFELARVNPMRTLDQYVYYMFPAMEINMVIDVGARKGEYGRLLRSNGYDGFIVSFEPVPEHFAVLERRCRNDAKWTAFSCAIGNIDGQIEINVTGSSEFSSLLQPKSSHTDIFSRHTAIERREIVSIKRLDGIFDQLLEGVERPRTLLKTDTQGYDLEVLRGASECFHHVSAVQCEMAVLPLYEEAPNYTEVIDHLRNAGFDLAAVFNLTHDSDFRLIEFDCVMVNTSLLRGLGDQQIKQAVDEGQ